MCCRFALNCDDDGDELGRKREEEQKRTKRTFVAKSGIIITRGARECGNFRILPLPFSSASFSHRRYPSNAKISRG